MTAWVKSGTREEVGIIVDFVDKEYVMFILKPDMIAKSVVQDYPSQQAAC
jgi:hypothetical protein